MLRFDSGHAIEQGHDSMGKAWAALFVMEKHLFAVWHGFLVPMKQRHLKVLEFLLIQTGQFVCPRERESQLEQQSSSAFSEAKTLTRYTNAAEPGVSWAFLLYTSCKSIIYLDTPCYHDKDDYYKNVYFFKIIIYHTITINCF